MKIKVEMCIPKIGSFKENIPNPKIIDIVTFTFYPKEPVCPFCGKPMKNARCCCPQFSKAFYKLQESLGDNQHNSFISIKSTAMNSSSFTINYQLVDEKMLNSNLFNEALTAKDSITDRKFLVSEGSTDDGKTIIFHLKMSDSEKSYKVTVLAKDGNQLELPTVSLIINLPQSSQGVSGSSGLCFKRKVLKNFSYNDFLAALQNT